MYEGKISNDELKAWDIYHAVLRNANPIIILNDEFFQQYYESLNFEIINSESLFEEKSIYILISLKEYPTIIKRIENHLIFLGIKKRFTDKRSIISNPNQYLIVYK